MDGGVMGDGWVFVEVMVGWGLVGGVIGGRWSVGQWYSVDEHEHKDEEDLLAEKRGKGGEKEESRRNKKKKRSRRNKKKKTKKQIGFPDQISHLYI